VNNQILITGAEGHIGGAVCKCLIQNQVPFITLDQYGCGKKDINEKIDLTKNGSFKRFYSFSFSNIIHCAAETPKSTEPDEYIRVAAINKSIDANVFSFAKATQARVIYTSGTSVFGFNIQEKVNEDGPIPNDLSPYIKQKYLSEVSALSLLEKVVVLRISAPYSHSQKTNTVLKIFIEKAIKGEDIYFHGTGNRQQDFTHVSDIANAVLKCIQNNHNKGTYNIASGRPIGMKELAELIVSNISNYKGKILPSGILDQQEDFKALFSIEKAKQELDWYPLINIEQGVRDWINHLQR